MDERKKEFLKALGEHGTVAGALRALGMHKTQYYRWRKSDPDFAAQADLILGSHNAAKAERRHGGTSGERRRENGAATGKRGKDGDGITGDGDGITAPKDIKNIIIEDENSFEPYLGASPVREAAEEEERLREALRERGTYAGYLEPRIRTAARAWAAAQTLWEDMGRYAALQRTISREGDSRLAINPLAEAYRKQMDSYAAHLKALGLDAGEEGAPAQSSRSAFFAALDDED